MPGKEAFLWKEEATCKPVCTVFLRSAVFANVKFEVNKLSGLVSRQRVRVRRDEDRPHGAGAVTMCLRGWAGDKHGPRNPTVGAKRSELCKFESSSLISLKFYLELEIRRCC